jgi:iron complex outermembrane receptor protein
MNRTIFTAMIILHTFVLAAQNLYEQNRSAGSRHNLSESATVVKGIIRTSDGKPAANVNVILKDTRFASVTNQLGEYYFYNVPEGGYTVVVSFTGLKTVQKEFDLKKGDVKVFDFTLYENQYQLAEIIIKAYNNNTKAAAIGKIKIRPMDLPQSIATVSETVIRDQQAQRLSDVVKNVNGVYLSSARASTQESFYARGYSFSSTNMFKNGSRVNSGVMPEVSSLESVEILKGSAAILYGNVSPGGILNMITKKPKFAFGGEVSMRAGSFNLWKPSIDLYGPLTKKIAYRLNATYESANSYRDQVSSTRYYINPSFLFKLGNKTELIVEGDFLNMILQPILGLAHWIIQIFPMCPAPGLWEHPGNIIFHGKQLHPLQSSMYSTTTGN